MSSYYAKSVVNINAQDTMERFKGLKNISGGF